MDRCAYINLDLKNNVLQHLEVLVIFGGHSGHIANLEGQPIDYVVVFAFSMVAPGILRGP